MVIMVTLIGSNPIPLAIPWTERSVPVRAWPAVQIFIEFFTFSFEFVYLYINVYKLWEVNINYYPKH